MNYIFRKCLLGFLLIFLVGSLQALSKVKKGFKKIQTKEYAEAVKLFDEVLNENPHSTSSYYGKSLIHFQVNSGFFDLESAYIESHKAKEMFFLSEKLDQVELAQTKVTLVKIDKLIQDVEMLLLHKAAEEHSISAFENYIVKHRDAANIDEAVLERNQVAFEFAVSENTFSSYQYFISHFPEAIEVPEARKRRNRLAYSSVKEENSVEALDGFIQKFPDADEVVEATRNRNQMAYIELLKEQKVVKQAMLEKQAEHRLRLEAENKEQRLEQESLMFGVMFMILIMFIAFLAYYFKRKDNEKIESHQAKIENQRDAIKRQHQQIIDSINYARVIQNAILPPVKKLKDVFFDLFVIYEPKDIVSGDFYWYTEVGNKKIVAAVDCTGHGVPGAFMSMIGNTLLNQIVRIKKITDPGLILDELRSEVVDIMHQSGESAFDGMDMSLCVIEPGVLKFAGAYNPLVHVSDTGFKLLKGDRMPIGRLVELKSDQKFTTHQIPVKAGDRLYLYSDGFSDQLGGPKLKKYTSIQFRDFLKSISNQSLRDQKKSLLEEFNKWKGKNDQTDDLLIIGIEI